jgi:hypothetical protein
VKKENRLQQLVIADPTAAAKDPIWQLLHLEDKHFLRKQPGPLKLHLLGLLSEEDQETLEERLSGKEVPIDVLRSNHVTTTIPIASSKRSSQSKGLA